MNVLRNFEAAFVVALGLAVCASYVMPSPDESPAAPRALAAHIATPSKMAVVIVPAKRMNAIEKERSLEDERRLAKQGGAAGSRI